MRRFGLRVIILGIFLGLLLAACTAETEQEPTPEPTAVQPEPTRPAPTNTAMATAVIAPTETATPANIAPTEQATEEAPTATMEPAFESLGALPVSEELALTIVDQWGGTPQSVALDGATAYIGFGPRLLVVNVSNPAEPALLGQSDILPDLVRGVDVVDGLAYLAAGNAGLVVLDVTDPAAVQVVSGGPNYAEDQSVNAQNITVIGDAAYLIDYNRSDGETMLVHFDLADSPQVTVLGEHRLPPNAAVQITEDMIVVAGMNQLQLRDVTKPASILSQTMLEGGSYTSRAVLQDNIVTVAECCAPSGIERFDVSDPYHPAAQGPFQEMELAPPFHVAADSSLMATASIFGEFGFCQSTVNLIGIDDESAQALASFDPENCLNDLVLGEEKLYLSGRSGLQIYDLADPTNPVLAGQFQHPAGFHDVQGLARHDGLTYVLNAKGRGFDLTTLDLSQQAPDLALGQQFIGQDVLLDLFISGETLVIPVWMGSLYTFEITDPTAPQLTHRPVEGELSSGDLFTIAIKDDVLYTPVIDGVSVGGIGYLDLSDPADPVLAGMVESGVPMILNLALEGDTLFVLGQGEQSLITLYDVSQPLAPEQIASLTMPEFVSRLAVVGDTLYASCDGHNCQAIYAIDASDKQNPDVTTRWTIPFGVRDMVSDEQGTIYLITSEQRIVTMDGSDPTQLRLTGSQQLPGEFSRLKIEGDQVYAAAFDGGLYQIQVER